MVFLDRTVGWNPQLCTTKCSKMIQLRSHHEQSKRKFSKFIFSQQNLLENRADVLIHTAVCSGWELSASWMSFKYRNSSWKSCFNSVGSEDALKVAYSRATFTDVLGRWQTAGTLRAGDNTSVEVVREDLMAAWGSRGQRIWNHMNLRGTRWRLVEGLKRMR